MDTFLSLCETKSYTKTAAHLHLTQPSVTQHIKFLEQYYGCQLFQYDGRRVEITAAGEYLHNKALILRAQEMEVQKHLSGFHQQAPLLEIGITPSASFTPAMQILCGLKWAGTTPRVHLHVADTRTVLRELQSGELDAAVLEGEISAMLVESTELYRERIIAVSDPEHAKALYGCTLPQLLEEHLLLMKPGCGLRSLVRRELNSRGLSFYDFASVLEVDSFWVLNELLRQKAGFAFLLECTAKQDLEEGRLGRIYIDTPSMYGKIYFVSMRERMDREPIAFVRNLLLQTPEELQKKAQENLGTYFRHHF